MEDPNLIATLIPADKEKRTEKAFRLKSNKERYLPPTQDIEEGPTLSSREATPAHEQPIDDQHQYKFTHRLQLTFDKEPKDPTKGYSFGTDPNKCDVVLGSRGAHQISGLHFYITFGVTFDGERHLMLRDLSTNGTAVSYSGQAKNEVRHNFTWILDLKKEQGKWEIEVHVRELRFKVELAGHETCKAEHDEEVEKFLRRSGSALPPLDVLGIHSHTTTAQPSQPLTPRQFPIYIREGNLGSGSFGRVDKVIDVSTSAVYARKEFYEPPYGGKDEERRAQKKDWLDRVRREVRIMKENPHENTVQVVDFREDPLPSLVMPYFPLGNLGDLHCESPIAVEETTELLFQTLNALKYLHPRGVAHRDLKPENILIESRSPLDIKLADFGLANDQPDLTTFCGTQQYTAPEVYLGSKYTASVDLWSLGVIILQYTYGLPRAPRQRRVQHQNSRVMLEEWGLAWCRRIVDHASGLDSDDLIGLLTTGLLRIKPEERLSARACLAKGHDLRLFDGHPLDSGNATPTRQTALQGETSDDDGSTTIILGALWDAEESHNSNGRIGCCTSEHITGVFESRNLQAPCSPSNGDGHSSQLESSKTALKNPGGSVQSSVDLEYPLEARATYSGGYKRHRSPAIGWAKNSSDKGRSKRRPSGVRLGEISVGRTYKISNQRIGHHGQSTQFGTIYDAVLALLMDLRLEDSKNQEINIDDSTGTLIGELCEYLARLEITGMRLTRNDFSGQTIFATGLDRRETVLASLTPSELMNSIADLAAHLLHMVQLQGPQLPSIPMVPVDDHPYQADIVTDGQHSQSMAVDSMDSHTTISTARQYGVTYPSALLDHTKISGC